MNTIIIIVSIVIACIAGYILRLGIECIEKEEIIIIKKVPLFSIPNHILVYFSLAIFLLLMSILMLDYTLEMPL